MTWFEYYGNQRVYCRTGGPSETPHNSILAFDENLEECWFYPPKNTELIRIHNIWEYQGICHLIASRSDDLNNDLIQICLDPKTGKELQKTDLQLDPMPEEFSFNGNTFIQKEEKVWILRADRKGTFIIHYKIKPNHTFEKLWQQYYAEIPRTEESSSYYREGFIKLIDDPDQSKSQIIMPFLYKENKVKKCCLFVIDPSIGSVIWESEGFNCNTLSIYPAKPYLLIDTGVDNDIKIGQKQWHSLISLDDTSGKIVWNKSFPDDYVKQHKNDYFEDNPLLISADKESFLIWHRIDNILYKVYASDGRIESCQFDKQATYFIEFLQADQHTYFQLDTWNKENSELLKSVVYKVE